MSSKWGKLEEAILDTTGRTIFLRLADGDKMQKTLLALAILLCCSIAVNAQQTQEPDAPQATSPAPTNEADDVKETTVLGCLSNSSGEITLTDASGTVYRLPGDRGLEPYVGHEVSISGTSPVSGTEPSITVTEVKDVLDPAAPIPSFAATEWRTLANKIYGFSIQYPTNFELLQESGPTQESNFANANGAIGLITVNIPDSIYPGSNFRGGYFTVAANPNISNAAACGQFRYADPQSVSSKMVNGIKYVQAIDGEGAAGSAYEYYYLHTYQNNLCYEFKVEIAAGNTGAYDLPCSISLISSQNKTDLLDAFLTRVSFTRPTLAGVPQRTRTVNPKVSAFTPSSHPTEHSLEVAVTWATQGVDYVHLEFECNNNLVVTGASDYLECGSSSNRNFSPNGSTTFLVSNPKGKAPVPFVVRLEPFSHGLAVPSQNKTVSIPVSPDPL
jgi:hypothetical protein